MDYDSLLELVSTRRSIRKFKTDPIPDEYVDKIIEVARWAPSGANSQPWEFIVIKKQELREKILELIKEQDVLSHKMEVVRPPEMRFHWAPSGYVRAPVFIILCGDVRTKDAYPVYTTLTRGNSHFTSGLASAFLYMSMATATLGLAGQWVSVIASPYVQTMAKDILGVPAELEMYDMLALGYPDTQPRPRQVRPREDMVHYDGYDMTRYRSDEQINQAIASLRHSRVSGES
ncbi:MAG: nitroreductase family protein [Chloroflexi bacterium]|nr:nitroreductase family protein [Chloroflexota bacterium]